MMHLPSARPKKTHECKGGHGRLLGSRRLQKEMGFEQDRRHRR